MRQLDGITDLVDMNLGKLREMVKDREALHTAGHGKTNTSGQTPGDDEGQKSLVCCSPWGHKEEDMTW